MAKDSAHWWDPPADKDPDVGTVAGTDHVVSFHTGAEGGPNEGETVIADGDQDRASFTASHDHYDGSGGGTDRGAYTGPGS